MLDLDTLAPGLMLFRGQYSTVRAAHEDEMKRMQMLCGELISVSSKVLKRVQIEDDSEPVSVAELIEGGRQILDGIEAASSQIESLAKQRAELKPLAWPKK